MPVSQAYVDDPWSQTNVAQIYAVFSHTMEHVGGFEATPLLMVAVSGGADSLALCLMAQKWAEANGGRVHAVTVDHGLRHEAAAEALQVEKWLRPYGISHSIVCWQGDKPTSGVQSAARDARYDLLDREAERLGALHVLVAHHADDQRETVVMRKMRGKGLGLGLAGMAAVTYRQSCRLLRPVLQLTKADLETVCRVLGQPWIEDPSNQSRTYERVRVRQDLMQKTQQAIRSLDADVQCNQCDRQAMESGLAEIVVRYVRFSPLGWAWIDRDLWSIAVDQDLRQLCLARVLQAVGGRVYAPVKTALARIEETVLHGSEAVTLAGCVLRARRGGVQVMREVGRVENIRHDAEKWDGRFCGDSGDLKYPDTHAEVRTLHAWLDGHSRGENTPSRSLIRTVPIQKAAVDGCLAPVLGYDCTPDGGKSIKMRFSPPQSLTYCHQWLAPLGTSIIS